MSFAAPTFLSIPVEIRLSIYDDYLAEHQFISKRQQPSNLHIRFLHTCRQIDREAGSFFRRYISFSNERQINAFILRADESLASHVEWADVANDGRVFSAPAPRSKDDEVWDTRSCLCCLETRLIVCKEAVPTPLSNLHLALRRMTSIKRLRVFQCRQGLPIDPQGSPSNSNLFLEPDTRVDPFDVVPPQSVETLRLSGECRIATHASRCAPRSFIYALGHRLGFELRNRHLESLAAARGAQLRTLVLLGCTRLTSTALATCLHNLPALEHFALGLLTVDELRTNFVLALPPGVAVVKLQVSNAWYAVPLWEEERGLCDALENTILRREVPPTRVCVQFRDGLMLEGGRKERWEAIARKRRFRLDVGPWEGEYMEHV
ncbi:hypothetical protein B0H21DRAFT_819283 [Amylocystis lapponica]|nr:hypothetical protein B0H21DRAFT_819283 [Amylocystis lapponica]